MFGRMTIDKVLDLGPKIELEIAVGALLAVAECARIQRRIQFPAAVLIILMCQDDPASATFYLLDRKTGVWLVIDFEDRQFGGYSLENCTQLIEECGLLSLVERPGLLRSGLNWVLQPGEQPTAVA